jgi:PIN domain nuclease of toxin-antitoxin system
MLLDTHVILWALANDYRLSDKARAVIKRAQQRFYSSVNLWEIGIKMGLGRGDFQLEADWSRSIPGEMALRGFKRIGIEPNHCSRVANLPKHHRDPFDRMLIAQAVELRCPIVSCDEKFDLYPVERIW